MDASEVRRLFVRHWEHGASDQDIAHEIYHDDAVLEFPQSGEQFNGKAKFQAFRERYPADLEFRIRRITGSGDVWIAENLLSYDGGPWIFTVNILEFSGDKVARERIYFAEAFEAPDWRAPWADSFDPLQAIDD
jgi:hypothetical protein